MYNDVGGCGSSQFEERVDIDYAELYGVKPGETDFSGAIERALDVTEQNYISEEFFFFFCEIRKERTQD